MNPIGTTWESRDGQRVVTITGTAPPILGEPWFTIRNESTRRWTRISCSGLLRKFLHRDASGLLGEVGPELQLRLWHSPSQVGLARVRRCVKCGTFYPCAVIKAIGANEEEVNE